MKITPISASERITVIDIIRGFAILGIFLVNMPSYHSPDLFVDLYGKYSGLDEIIRLLFDMFIQGKFYTIFSFLFGLGFFIFMKRAEEKGLPASRLFIRRLFVLLLFGIFHLMLLWYGDILHTYALAGFLLLFFHKRTNKLILGWAFGLLIVMSILFSLALLSSGQPGTSEQQEYFQEQRMAEQKMAKEAISVYNDGSFTEWLQFRWTHEIPLVLVYMPIPVFSVLPLFLFGFYAGRKGIFQYPAKHEGLIKKVWWASLLLSLPLVTMIPLIHWDLIQFSASKSVANYVFVQLSGYTLFLFYMSSIVLLVRQDLWKKIFYPFSYVGRMALTNYLWQTIFSLAIFLPFHLYGKVSLAAGLLICLIIYPLQVIVSRFWLKHYRFGPFEWLWRSITYGKIQSMKKERK